MSDEGKHHGEKEAGKGQEMPVLEGVGAFLILRIVVVREGYQTRWCWSRNLKEVRECRGKNIPGKCKGPAVEI